MVLASILPMFVDEPLARAREVVTSAVERLLH